MIINQKGIQSKDSLHRREGLQRLWKRLAWANKEHFRKSLRQLNFEDESVTTATIVSDQSSREKKSVLHYLHGVCYTVAEYKNNELNYTD